MLLHKIRNWVVGSTKSIFSKAYAYWEHLLDVVKKYCQYSTNTSMDSISVEGGVLGVVTPSSTFTFPAAGGSHSRVLQILSADY